jgi:hypothetical protein
MNRGNFFSELKRRNVIRAAGLYLVGAWLLTQVAPREQTFAKAAANRAVQRDPSFFEAYCQLFYAHAYAY